jgi:hypothetical protein
VKDGHILSLAEGKDELQFGIYIFSNCILCSFSYLSGCDINLLLILIYCFETNYTVDIREIILPYILLCIHHIEKYCELKF